MKTFFCKLVPPRPTFAQDMSDAEASLMQAHATYWRGLMDEGLAVGFGHGFSFQMFPMPRGIVHPPRHDA